MNFSFETNITSEIFTPIFTQFELKLFLQEFNVDSFEMEIVKCNAWSKDATDIMNEWICGEQEQIFTIEMMESGRLFGQLQLYCSNNNQPFSIANGLCQKHEAMEDDNYLNGM